MKEFLTSVILLTLLAFSFGCGSPIQTTLNVPPRDATPMQLIPKQVEGLSLTSTRELAASMIGAELGARGVYLSEHGTKYIIEIYRFSSREDANKLAVGIEHDIKRIQERQKNQVIVFTSGAFLFAVWGKSAYFVEEIARATGFYKAPSRKH